MIRYLHQITRRRWPLLPLAALAYIPALMSSPGRMPADSKLYLYLNPGRLLSDAALSFDPRQFAGWVPHQHISYLWPTGPFYWLSERIGVPDWIAHRLWIGTVLFTAGAGMWWCARKFGLGAWAALAAAFVYQLSPYLLPYISRTSVMLLPWAGLGWIVGLSVIGIHPGLNACEGSRRLARWRSPALIALVVFTVGAVNATALAMVVPAPVLWLLYCGLAGHARWRTIVGFAARTGALCVAVSLWWIAMLIIQGRYGADVLPYSEALSAVSFTSTGPEIWRALGYWLFYINDASGPTTSAALPYLTSGRTIAAGYLIVIVALVAAVFVRWAYRRFALACLTVGAVLAVGVHPIDDRSPLMELLTDGDSGLALALRSSTRALPVMLVGVSLLIGGLVESLADHKMPWTCWSLSHLATALIALLALLNMPAAWQHSLVDRAIDRDQSPPAAWVDAAKFIDSGSWGDPADGRMLQIPGVEFGAFEWGYTVDQPLPSLTEKPVVTRDLLPLGSPGAMDVLFAFDDRIQNGVLEPSSIKPVAGLLGADTVWLTGDLDWQRFNSARPASVADPVAAVADQTMTFGNPSAAPDSVVLDEHSVVGEPVVAPVTLADLGTSQQIVRARSGLVAVSGSGDGLVDSAAVHDATQRFAVRYTADQEAPLNGAGALIITDSNRNRNRDWRSSQDSTAATLTADAAVSVGEAGRRLPVFETTDPTTRTNTTIQGWPSSVEASGYGEPWRYLPEHRAAMAFDEYTDTAWMVGDHGDPVGEWISFTIHDIPENEKVEQITIDQYAPILGQRTIGQIGVAVAVGGTTREFSVAVDPDPSVPIVIDLDAPAGATVTLTIDSVIGGQPLTRGIVSGVGFSNIDTGLPPLQETVVMPSDAAVNATASTPLAVSMTRERVDPLDHWRDDPEPVLRRTFATAASYDMSVSVTARLDRRMDDARLAEIMGWPVAASSRLTGSLLHAGVFAVDGDESTAWTTAFDQALGSALKIDNITAPIESIAITQSDQRLSQVTEITLSAGDDERVVELSPPDQSGVRTAVVDPPLEAATLTVMVSAIDEATTIDRRFGDLRQLPVSISELNIGGLPTVSLEPTDSPVFGQCIELVGVEPGAVALAGQLSFDLDALGGAPLNVKPCRSWTMQLESGRHYVSGALAPPGINVDSVELRTSSFDELVSAQGAVPTANVVSGGPTARTIEVEGCPTGCWLVFGEGYSPGWSAQVDGNGLGQPQMLDGGFNGWWLEGDATVNVNWKPQRTLTIALLASAFAVITLIALLAIARRRPIRSGPDETIALPVLRGLRRGQRKTIAIQAVVWVLLASLIVGPWWGLWAAIAGVVMVITRWRRLPELVALATVVAVATTVVWTERRGPIRYDAGWPQEFESYHHLAMFAVATCATAALPSRFGHRWLASPST